MAEDREGGSTSSAVAEDQIFVEEAPAIIQQEQNLGEEYLQEKNLEPEERSPISKKRQKRRRAITYVSNISKQLEKNRNQIDRITTLIHSLQKARLGLRQSQSQSQSQSRSIKQIKSQLSQLLKQVSRVQKDVQKLRTASARNRKLSSTTTTMKPKSRMSKKKSSNSIQRNDHIVMATTMTKHLLFISQHSGSFVYLH
jgi:ABC-type phosphate transport system auxiliary subunit